jgi:hypothetical protein
VALVGRTVVAGALAVIGEVPDRPGGGHHFPQVVAYIRYAHEPTAQPRNDSVSIEITIN